MRHPETASTPMLMIPEFRGKGKPPEEDCYLTEFPFVNPDRRRHCPDSRAAHAWPVSAESGRT